MLLVYLNKPQFLTFCFLYFILVHCKHEAAGEGLKVLRTKVGLGEFKLKEIFLTKFWTSLKIFTNLKINFDPLSLTLNVLKLYPFLPRDFWTGIVKSSN